MKNKGGLISAIEQGSLAQQTGLKVGDRIVSVNDQLVTDLIDMNFALSEEHVKIMVEDSLGNSKTHYFQRRFGDTIGIEVEEAVFDSVRQCANNCVFCFIHQMPKGMRESLYVKDDDYRMSFLHGNFITLTNMTDRDWKRIESFHLSPLYVSIHTTNGELRERMINHIGAGKIKEHLHRLESHGIDVHGQIVMCPGYNDQDELRKTLEDLYNEFTNILDVAVVPVGLTQFRDDLPTIQPVDKKMALETIALVKPIQEKARKERGTSFVYLADEFYIQGQAPFPSNEEYDGFMLLEDGIGMARKFDLDWQSYVPSNPLPYEKPTRIAIVVGTAIGEQMKERVQALHIDHLTIDVIPVENTFFGTTINVTGLLTATDIIRAIKCAEVTYDGVIIPGVCLRKGVPVFLDDATVDDVEKALDTQVRICHFATDCLEQLYRWR